MIFIQIALLLALSGCINTTDDLVVQLPYGKIRGYIRKSEQGNSYYAFQEIPYAAPPVGIDRFQAPKDPIPWTGIKNTTKNNFICFQPDRSTGLEMSEDCLFLNVFSPVKPGSNQKLPVLFFIHGGGYSKGSCANMYPTFMIDYGIVLVVINYRLGSFGFTSTQDDTISGNAGLKDQLKALEWVHDNIHLFGGDNTRVTVNGGSAGSMSICFHILGPWNNNKVLFHAAILESGNELFHGTNNDNKEKAFEMGRTLNKTFNSNDTKELLKVLLRATPEEILKVGSEPGPVIEEDGPFSYRPYKSLATGNFKKVPLFMGFTSEEALWLAFTNLTDQMLVLDRDPSIMFLSQFNMTKINRTIAGNQVRRVYTKTSFLDYPGGFIRFTSDMGIVSPTCRHAQIASKYTNVYLYEFAYEGKLGTTVSFPFVKGTDRVAHGEDGGYIWDMIYNSDLSKFPADDRLTSERMVKLFANFIKYQNPTPTVDALFENITWPPVDPNQPEKIHYLNINKTLEVRVNPRNFQEMFHIIDRYITPNDII